MQEVTAERLQIAYTGPATENGRMPMEALANGLHGQALLIRRVAELMYGDSVRIQVEVDADFDTGSLIIPVHILYEGLKAAEGILASEPATAVANLMQFLGFFGVSGLSIYKLFKRLKGRPIQKPEDLPPKINIDVPIDVLIEVYNDPEVQAQVRRAIDPLHTEGIEEFQTRREEVTLDSVKKADLLAADEAEVEALTRDEEVILDIEKAAWRRSLAWHFADGKNSFDAKITDEAFWKVVERGEQFAVGDRMKAHLKTTARRLKNGKLKTEREIPTVIEVEHESGRQRHLFRDDAK